MRIKLHYKIAGTFCIITAAVMLGIFSYLDTALKDYVYEKIKTAITKEVLLTKLFLEEDFSGYHRFKEISALSISVGEVIDARISFIGLDGTVLGDSDLPPEEVRGMDNHLERPEVQEALKNGLGYSRRFSTTLRRDMLYIAALVGKEVPDGIIRAAVPLTDIEIISGRLKRLLVAGLAAAFFIAVLAAFTAAFFITRPLKKMSEAAMDISGGRFDKKISAGSNDEIGDLAGSFNHMTERIKETINEITEQKARLEAVFLSMSDGVMIVDKKNRIVLVNRALEEIFPAAGSGEGKMPLEIIRNAEVQDISAKLLNDSPEYIKHEICLHSHEERSIVVHGAPVKREGFTEGAVLVFHDITEIRKLERMRKDFVANVSHELRTPASNIKGFAETLTGGAIDDREHRAEFVKIIEENADRLVRLIEDLLDLSRIESGKVPLKRTEISVKDIINKVEEAIRGRAEEKRITIKNTIEADMGTISLDEEMVYQALFNLADNALKYTPENGQVTFSARRVRGDVEIEVRDTGVGISEEHIGRIFERFYRVDRSRSRATGSTGLGLSIVKHIAEAHGGSVRVISCPGKGTSFFLTFPTGL